MTTHEQAHRHDPVYDRLHETAEFTELRRRYRGFVFPATVAFLAWYLLYVVMSMLGPRLHEHSRSSATSTSPWSSGCCSSSPRSCSPGSTAVRQQQLDPLARELNDDYDVNKREGDGA